MSDKHLIPTVNIERRIYLVRGQRVMLDRDLAELYGRHYRGSESSREAQP